MISQYKSSYQIGGSNLCPAIIWDYEPYAYYLVICYNPRSMIENERMASKEDTFHLGIKAIIRNSDGNILLLKTNPDELRGYEGEGYWDIPGGRIQKNQTVEETLKREVKEETGISSIKSHKPFTMVLSNLRIPTDEGSVGLILAAYLCDINPSAKVKISKEHIDYQWFSPREAVRLLSFKYPEEFTEKLKTLG
jgi:8-oxo-dGTP pyrophosphatase MutT (NUDIX family)